MASTHQFDVANLFGVKGMVAVVTGGMYHDPSLSRYAFHWLTVMQYVM